MKTRRYIPLFISALLGVAGGMYLPASAFKSASSSLVTFASFVAAAVVPAAILAATLLRSSGLRPKEIDDYAKAIRDQIMFLFGILILAASLIGLIIFHEITAWRSYSTVFELAGYQLPFHSRWISNFSVSFLATLLTFRLGGFFSAINSMFVLHVKTVKSEALGASNEWLEKKFAVHVLPKDTRMEFGKTIPLTGKQPE